MNQQYCVIYGYNDNDPGPFIIGVTKNQDMINGFREEHYHFCRGGEILTDNLYDQLSSDYEIMYTSGHYLTPKILTEFMEYLTAEFNQLTMLVDTINRDVEYLIFNETEQDIISDGLDFLHETLYEASYGLHMDEKYGTSDPINDSIYASVLNIPECLDRFLSTYQPSNGLF